MFFFMTSHLNSHKTTDIKPEMLSGVQTGNGTPHGRYNICGIAHAGTNRKDDIIMQRWQCKTIHIYIEVGVRDLYIEEAHTALDILRFAAFFLTPSCYTLSYQPNSKV